MAFRVPIFPLVVNVWRNANPTTNAPDVVTVGNLSWGLRVATGQAEDVGVTNFPLARYLLLPSGADVRGVYNATGQDTVEVPAGSGRFYVSMDSEEIGYGFQNWHREAVILPIAPFPIAPAGPPAPPVANLFARSAGPSVLTDSAAIPAITGSIVVVAFSANVAGLDCALLSANLGVITPSGASSPIAGIGASGLFTWFLLAEAGVADTLTISSLGSGVILWFAISIAQTTEDQAIGATSSATPSIQGPTPTITAVPETALVFGGVLGTGVVPSFSPPFAPALASVLTMADSLGNTWNMFVGQATYSALQPALAVVPYTSVPPSASTGTIVTYK